MDLLFVCQFLFLTIALMVMGVLVGVALFASTEKGRDDLLNTYDKWRFRRDLKRKFQKGDFKYAMPIILPPPEERTLLPYSEEDIKMVYELHKHLTKPHASIYDEVAWDHGFYPHEDNDTENA